MSGKLTTTLVNEKKFEVGRHTVNWNANGLATGIYFIEFKAGMKRQVKKVTLIK